MRRSLVVFGAMSIVLLGTTGLVAEEIIKSFESPYGYYSYGLTWDGEHLWCGDDRYGPVAQIDTSDGSIITTIDGAPQSNHGLAWDGTHLWVSGDYHTDWIYRIAPNGDRVDSILNPGGDYSGGMTWDGTHLWVTRYYPNTQPNLFRVDVSTGTVKDTIPSQGLQPQGLAWDGTYLWNVQDDNDGDPELVWQLDPVTGDTLLSFPVPDTGGASGQSPRGLAWDGEYLWLVSKGPGTTSRYIYKIDPFGGGVPDIWLSADEHDYGHTIIGSPEDWTLGISNMGSADLVVDSVISIWRGADWFEREAFDLFGIEFKGHPDLRRLLLPDNWRGYPLRKDYPIKGPEDWEYPEYQEAVELHRRDDEWTVK